MISDPLDIFSTTSGAFSGFDAYQVIAPPNRANASMAGLAAPQPGISRLQARPRVWSSRSGSPASHRASPTTSTPRSCWHGSGSSSPLAGSAPHVAGYLKRLVSSLGAYQLADVLSKLMAILLLPVYTRLHPAGRLRDRRDARDGRDLRLDRRPLRDDRVVPALLLRRRGPGAPGRARASRVPVPARRPRRRRGRCWRSPPPRCRSSSSATRDPADVPDRGARRVGVHEPRARLRAAPRRRAPARVRDRVADERRDDDRLLAPARRRARPEDKGLLLGNYGASAFVLLGLWWTMRERLLARVTAGRQLSRAAPFRSADRPGRGVRLRTQRSRPAVPRSPARPHARPAGSTRSRSSSPARSRSSSARSSTPGRRWPTRSPTTPRRRASTASSRRTTCCSAAGSSPGSRSRRAGSSGCSPRTPFFEAYRAVPWVSLGWAMYGLWVVFLVIAGRAQVTRRNFPAAFVGLAVNIVLLIVLVPSYGIVGAGVALCGAYAGDARSSCTCSSAVCSASLRVAPSRPHRAAERRVSRSSAISCSRPTAWSGSSSRALVFAAIPPALLLSGFAHREEVVQARALLARARAYRRTS